MASERRKRRRTELNKKNRGTYALARFPGSIILQLMI